MVEEKDKEKQRLLDSIEIIKQFDDDVDIRFENLNLNFYHEIFSDSDGIQFFSDIIMDSEVVKKYDAKNSKITINYTAYDNENKILANTNYVVYFDDPIGPPFKGFETISPGFHGFRRKDVAKIRIVIDALLSKKETPEDILDAKTQEDISISKAIEEIDNKSKKVIELRKRLLNSIERIPATEEKLGIDIDNVGLKIEQLDAIGLTFYMEVSVKSTEWNYIEFTCVLYDDENDIIDKTTKRLYSDGFTGSDVLMFYIMPYASNIHKVKIYPSRIR